MGDLNSRTRKHTDSVSQEGSYSITNDQSGYRSTREIVLTMN